MPTPTLRLTGPAYPIAGELCATAKFLADNDGDPYVAEVIAGLVPGVRYTFAENECTVELASYEDTITARDLAAIRRGIEAHGIDGRKGSLPVYSSAS